MGHKYYQNARRNHVDAYEFDNARAAITSNYKRGIIGREIAAMQLAAAGAFRAEIEQVLS